MLKLENFKTSAARRINNLAPMSERAAVKSAANCSAAARWPAPRLIRELFTNISHPVMLAATPRFAGTPERLF